ncbi:DUF4906 domain-containing protein [Parabacteroides sp.]
MKKGEHQVSVYHCIVILSACLLAGLSSSCSDDIEKEGGGGTGNEGTDKITLPVNLTFTPITETKAVTRPVKPGSELEKAGFHYELEVVSSTTVDTLSAPDTKAVPTQLKNVVALLFGETTGAYKGKAVVSTTVTAGSDLLLDFTVNTTTDTSYRLVVVANDNAAKNPYSSTPALSAFTGSYAEFLDIQMGYVNADEDVPYVGSITGIKMEGASGTLVVPLYWSLAKIHFKLNNFSIKGGPAFRIFDMSSMGYRYFGTPGGYDGSGSTATLSSRIGFSTAYALKDYTLYIGENIQTNSSITSTTDRYPAKAGKAARLYLETESMATTNTTPAIGEEYITSGGVSFKYNIYFGDGSVSDFSVRRNTKYTVTVNIDGTLEGQRRQAQTDKRIEVVSNEVHAGLNIGKLGGPVEFTTGTGAANTITGYYTKDLLIEPNTTRTTATDNLTKALAPTTTALQTENRKYWDPNYTLGHIDKTTGYAYDYCKSLTLGNVSPGTWYLPTVAQLTAIWGVLQGLKGNDLYANYSAFYTDFYWSSTEYAYTYTFCVSFADGHGNSLTKTNPHMLRCVRDL